jgi:hypothetical protein
MPRISTSCRYSVHKYTGVEVAADGKRESCECALGVAREG